MLSIKWRVPYRMNYVLFSNVSLVILSAKSLLPLYLQFTFVDSFKWFSVIFYVTIFERKENNLHCKWGSRLYSRKVFLTLALWERFKCKSLVCLYDSTCWLYNTSVPICPWSTNVRNYGTFMKFHHQSLLSYCFYILK